MFWIGRKGNAAVGNPGGGRGGGLLLKQREEKIEHSLCIVDTENVFGSTINTHV